MIENTSGSRSMIENVEFCFRFGGTWRVDEDWSYDSINSDVVVDEVASSSTSTQATRPPKLTVKRHFKASNMMVGIGVHVDMSTGQTTLNPGLTSERLINEGEEVIPHNSDPVIKGAIPNERHINALKLRSIKLREGPEVRQPTSLPFKPPGLQWKGAPSITTRQLLEQQEKRKNARPNTSETSASTTTNLG